MVEEPGIVVSIDQTGVWVETQRQSACGACAANKGCGSAVLQKVLGKKRNIVRAVASMPVAVGDHVVLGLQEKALVKGSMLVYALPIVLIIVFAIIAETITVELLSMDAETGSIFGALIGMVFSYFWLNRFGKVISKDEKYQPVILRYSHTVTLQSNYNLLG